MMRRLVNFDLDMTLLGHATYAIPGSVLEALERLQERGFVVALATGRDMDNRYNRESRGMVGADVVIHMNGTKVTVGGKLIYEHHMDRKLLEQVLDFVRTQGYSVGMTIGDEDFYTHNEQVVAHDIRCWDEYERQFKDPMKLLGVSARTLAYVGAPEGVYWMGEAFLELELLLFTGLQGADVVEKAASKVQEPLRLCDYYGIDVKGTYAFGGSMNDYEIVQTVGTGIAMGNTLDVLKETAGYVTADIREDRVYKACVHFGLIQYGEKRILM